MKRYVSRLAARSPKLGSENFPGAGKVSDSPILESPDDSSILRAQAEALETIARHVWGPKGVHRTNTAGGIDELLREIARRIPPAVEGMGPTVATIQGALRSDAPVRFRAFVVSKGGKGFHSPGKGVTESDALSAEGVGIGDPLAMPPSPGKDRPKGVHNPDALSAGPGESPGDEGRLKESLEPSDHFADAGKMVGGEFSPDLGNISDVELGVTVEGRNVRLTVLGSSGSAGFPETVAAARLAFDDVADELRADRVREDRQDGIDEQGRPFLWLRFGWPL